LSIARADAISTEMATVEIDRLGAADSVLVTLRTRANHVDREHVSTVALTGCPHLEELPEVLRAIGFALVYEDGHSAHGTIGKLLEQLAELG